LRVATALASALACLHEKRLVHRDIKPSNIVFVNGQAKLADIGLVTDSETNASFVGTEGYVPPEGPGTPKADLHLVTSGRASEPRAEGKRAAREALVIALAVIALLGLSVLVWEPTWLGFGPPLRQVRELSSPLVSSWAPAHVGCVNGDGEPEICIVAENRLLVFSSYRDRMMEWTPEQVGANDVRLDLLADSNGDGCADILVGWRVGEELFISVINSNGGQTNRFTNKGTVYRQKDGRLSASELKAEQVADLEGDGRLELLARVHTGAGGRPRGLCCYSVDTRQLRWSFPTAPNVLDVACVDLNGDRVLDIILSTQAPSQGNTETDGTDDGHTYLFALDGKSSASSAPTCLWRVDLWDFYSQAHVLLDPANRALYDQANRFKQVCPRGDAPAVCSRVLRTAIRQNLCRLRES